MGCNCGKPKCDGHCNASPAVLQINNPSECVLFHKVEIPASMGNEITIPPKPGLYKNVLLYYEATGSSYFYSSDGIPTPISYTDYTRLTNKPSINGVSVSGAKNAHDYGLQNELIAGSGITISGNTISASGAKPRAFTMQYSTRDGDGRPLPGWNHMYDNSYVEKVKVLDSRPNYPIYKYVLEYTDGVSSATETTWPVTFLDEETSEALTPQTLYNLLVSGEDVVLNHVPLGFTYYGEWTYTETYADGVHLTRNVGPTYDQDAGEMIDGTSIGFSGTAFISAAGVDGDALWVQSQFGFTIYGAMSGGTPAYQAMTIQGLADRYDG